jgi:two-component sensor histidine kinase
MINSLNEINELKNQSIKDKNRSIIFISSGLLIIVLLSIGMFFAYHQKKKAHEHISLLMQESRHRTKNNLQLLSSILSLHSDQVSEEHRDAVMAAEYRVQSIVLLNKQLDFDERGGRISLANYFSNLSEGLLDAYTSENQIQLITHFEDILVLPHQATHLGLIVNELITNSLKYAFNESLEAIIKIDCLYTENNKCKLIISDNGSGLPKNWEEKTESSLGMNLVRDLSTQLKAKILIENRNGFYFQLVFQVQ